MPEGRGGRLPGVTISMKNGERLSLDQLRTFQVWCYGFCGGFWPAVFAALEKDLEIVQKTTQEKPPRPPIGTPGAWPRPPA